MSDEPNQRPGLNPTEAAIAWAFAHFGGDAEAIQVLESDAAADVRSVVESLEGLEDDEQSALVERWRREDRRWDKLEELVAHLDETDLKPEAQAMSSRWRRALGCLTGDEQPRRYPWQAKSVRTRRAIVSLALGPLREHVSAERPELRRQGGFEFESLVDMAPSERERFIRRLGVFQLAELARKQDRRHLARLRRTLSDADRRWFDECIKRERSIDRVERGRLREVFLAVSRQEPELVGRLLHLGAYSIAAAAGERFAGRLESVAERLPSALCTLLNHYHLLDAEAGLPSLEAAFRRALDEYVARLEESSEARNEVARRGER